MSAARHKAGYILFEAVFSLGLLSVSVLAINASLRQAVLVKGDAQDYTQARFILEEKIAELEAQRELTEMSDSGRGTGGLSRFQWLYKVSKIPLPEPEIPPDVPPDRAREMKLPAAYLAKIEVTVTWTRAGVEHSETLETIYRPWKIWTPPEAVPGGVS